MQEIIMANMHNNPLFLVAQLVGFVGMIIYFFSFQTNKKNRILILVMLSSAVWGVHYLLLGAFTGASLNFIEVVRNAVFSRGEKLKRPLVWAILFSALFALTGFFTWIGILGLGTTVVSILVTFAFCFGNTRVIRICATISAITWLMYNASELSVAGTITEGFALLSLMIAFWRFDIRKKPQVKEKNDENQ